MANERRRTSLGGAASAAIPILWAEIERRGWSHAELARQLHVDKAMVAKMLYGERRAGRDLALLCRDLLGTPIESWSKPLPRGWRLPHVRMARELRVNRPASFTEEDMGDLWRRWVGP